MKIVFVVYKKINKEIVAFGNIEIGKRKLHHPKNVILLEDVDIEKNTGIQYDFFRLKVLSIMFYYDYDCD